jgi:hypothetical protein
VYSKVIDVTKPAEPATDNRHLFIVRIWLEDDQLTSGGQWRGSAEHVPSGRRIYFVSLDALLEFMTEYWGCNRSGQAAD